MISLYLSQVSGTYYPPTDPGQITGIGVGAGVGGATLILLVGTALVLALVAIHKRYRGGGTGCHFISA